MRRTLASGPIRFGVAERGATPDNDPPTAFSTGPRGEFVRHGAEGLYFAEQRDVGVGPLDDADDPSRLTVWALLRPEGRSVQSYLPLAAAILGGLLVVLGAGVVARKGDWVGWVEAGLGVALIAAPAVIAAGRLRILRERARNEREERERAEMERKRIVGAFAERLETLAADPSRRNIDAVRKERREQEIPYDAVAPLGRAAVAQVGFAAIARIGELGPSGVAASIREAADAVGLHAEDVREACRLVVQKIIWHLLADDRMTEGRRNLLGEIGRQLGLPDEELSAELRADAQLGVLRGVNAKSLPSVDSGGTLRFGEACLHRSRGAILKRLRRGGLREQGGVELYVTPRRLLLAGKPAETIDYAEIFGLEVDADQGLLAVKLRERRAPMLFRLDDPIVTAQMIELASTLPPKPKGLI